MNSDALTFGSLAVELVGMVAGFSALCMTGPAPGPLVVVTCRCSREGCSGVRLVPAERLARFAG